MSTITTSHVVGLGLSIVFLYRGYRLAREQREEVLEFVVWMVFGGAIGILTLGGAVTGVGVVEAADMVFWTTGSTPGVGMGILILLGSLIFAVVYSHVRVKQLHEELVDVQRELAFLRYETEQQRELSTEAVDRASEEEYESLGGKNPVGPTSSESTVGVQEE